MIFYVTPGRFRGGENGFKERFFPLRANNTRVVFNGGYRGEKSLKITLIISGIFVGKKKIYIQ
jgi:hypothetical protein